jgi:hypothetical protein
VKTLSCDVGLLTILATTMVLVRESFEKVKIGPKISKIFCDCYCNEQIYLFIFFAKKNPHGGPQSRNSVHVYDVKLTY